MCDNNCDRLFTNVIYGKLLKGEKNTSYFSEELQKLIRERNVKIYVLAAASGIDRTLIHKILKGDRIPSHRSMVQKLACVLLLTPEESEKLMDSYQLAKMGEDNYSRRKNIQDFFNVFHNTSELNSIIVKTDYRHQVNVLPNNAVVYGCLEINNLVKTVIEMEASRKNGKIQIIAQPEYSFLFELLASIGMDQRDWKIDHVICLGNSLKGKDSLYNLNCFRTIMPIILSGCEYNPMCYYDNVASHISSTSIMPYMLLTSGYVINISYDISYATISDSSQYIELYRHTFEDFIKKSTPMLTITHNHQAETLPPSVSLYGYIRYSLSFDPHLVSFMSEKTRNKYLQPDFSKQEETNIGEQIQPSKDGVETVYFTEEGLDRFLNTGVLPKMYQEFFSPLDMADRYVLLKKMYDMTLAGDYHPVLINSVAFNIPEYLSIIAFQNAVNFMFILPDNESSICTLEEKSLVYAFHDFFKYLPESSMVLSPEETLAVIKQKLDNEPIGAN